MVNADRYHLYAGECRALAQQLPSENQRRVLLDIAQEWESLARGRRRRAAKNPASTTRWLQSAFHMFW
jgi:hypothetical protein